MTNRMRLLRIANDLQQIKRDPAVGPTPYEHLEAAVQQVIAASRWALSSEERGQQIDGFGR